MIQIERRREPAELVSTREIGLARARAALRSGARIELSGYEIAKAALAEMQHYKCCYCEKVEEQSKYRDVEHYRPKSQYWWLTWTWDNLLFACVDCNREHKRDRFPLALGSIRLAVEQLPPGSEQPLVLDPADRGSDPTAEIEFRPQRGSGSGSGTGSGSGRRSGSGIGGRSGSRKRLRQRKPHGLQQPIGSRHVGRRWTWNGPKLWSMVISSSTLTLTWAGSEATQ